MTQETFEPQHVKPTAEQLEKAKSEIVRIPIAGDTAFMLKHASARMGTLKRLTYNQVIQLLLIQFDLGKGFGTIRDHPRVTEILGSR